MKVFLSWSGDLSHKVACALRDWLPMVVQSIRPYVSSEDIDKGTRWSTDIAKELAESTFGVLCITQENLHAPWINFEAGALSKTIDKANVSPFLFRMKRSEVQGPLLQFQSTVYEKDDVFKLLVSINNRLAANEQLEDVPLRRSFEVWWPQLEQQLDAIPIEAPEVPKPATKEPEKLTSAILEELLELARNQQKLLRSPAELLPPDYLDFALRESRHFEPEADMAISEAHERVMRLAQSLSHSDESKEPVQLITLVPELERILRLLHRALPRRRRGGASERLFRERLIKGDRPPSA